MKEQKQKGILQEGRKKVEREIYIKKGRDNYLLRVK
jgi:hypothetical protein